MNPDFWYCLNRDGGDERLVEALRARPGLPVLFRAPSADQEHVRATRVFSFLETQTDPDGPGPGETTWRRVAGAPVTSARASRRVPRLSPRPPSVGRSRLARGDGRARSDSHPSSRPTSAGAGARLRPATSVHAMSLLADDMADEISRRVARRRAVRPRGPLDGRLRGFRVRQAARGTGRRSPPGSRSLRHEGFRGRRRRPRDAQGGDRGDPEGRHRGGALRDAPEAARAELEGYARRGNARADDPRDAARDRDGGSGGPRRARRRLRGPRPRWEKPLLVVVGDEDAIAPPSDAEAMTAVATQASWVRLVTVPGAGHLVPLEQPDEAAAALSSLAEAIRQDSTQERHASVTLRRFLDLRAALRTLPMALGVSGLIGVILRVIGVPDWRLAFAVPAILTVVMWVGFELFGPFLDLSSRRAADAGRDGDPGRAEKRRALHGAPDDGSRALRADDRCKPRGQRADCDHHVPRRRLHHGSIIGSFHTTASLARAAQDRAQAEIARFTLEAENARKTQELEEARALQVSMLPSAPPDTPGLRRRARHADGDGGRRRLLRLAGRSGRRAAARGRRRDGTRRKSRASGGLGEDPVPDGRAERGARRRDASRERRGEEPASPAHEHGAHARDAFPWPGTHLRRAACRPFSTTAPSRATSPRCSSRRRPPASSRVPRTREKEIALTRGDRLLFFTDGLPELRDERGDLFGYERVRDVFLHAAPGVRANDRGRALRGGGCRFEARGRPTTTSRSSPSRCAESRSYFPDATLKLGSIGA